MRENYETNKYRRIQREKKEIEEKYKKELENLKKNEINAKVKKLRKIINNKYLKSNIKERINAEVSGVVNIIEVVNKKYDKLLNQGYEKIKEKVNLEKGKKHQNKIDNLNVKKKIKKIKTQKIITSSDEETGDKKKTSECYDNGMKLENTGTLTPSIISEKDMSDHEITDIIDDDKNDNSNLEKKRKEKEIEEEVEKVIGGFDEKKRNRYKNI